MLLWSCRALCPKRNQRCSRLQGVRNYHVVFHLLDSLQQADFGARMRSYRAKHRNCCSVVVVFSPMEMRQTGRELVLGSHYFPTALEYWVAAFKIVSPPLPNPSCPKAISPSGSHLGRQRLLFTRLHQSLLIVPLLYYLITHQGENYFAADYAVLQILMCGEWNINAASGSTQLHKG